MKHVFHIFSRISGAARPRRVTDSVPIARLLTFGFLTATRLFLTAPAMATSVVALIDNANHRVVIAADCRVNRELVSHSECKIIEEPGCTVAIAGLYRETTTGFNLRELADAACRYPGDLRQKAEAFLRLSRKTYEATVRQIRETDLAEFRRTMANKPTEVIFAGLLKGRITLLVRGFVSDQNGKIATERYESSDAPNSSIGYFVGLTGHIRERVKPSNQWERLGYAEAARRFVEIEIEANPDLAGPPFPNLRLTITERFTGFRGARVTLANPTDTFFWHASRGDSERNECET